MPLNKGEDMKPYRGFFIIECEAKTCKKGLKDNVEPSCMACHKGVCKVFDLDGDLVRENRAPKERKEVKKK